MAWAKLDDKAHGHRKQLAAGLEAVGFWAMALSYASDHGTNGVIAREVLCAVYPAVSPMKARALARRLVEVGLWDEHPEGWSIHDFLEYNPTVEEVEYARDLEHTQKSEAGRIGGLRSADVRRQQREAAAQARASDALPSTAQAPACHPASQADEAESSPDPYPTRTRPVPDPLPNGPVPQDAPLRPGCRPGRRAPPGAGITVAVCQAYLEAYARRYGKPPVVNGRVRGQFAALVARLGATEAPAVAAFYVTLNRSDYVRAVHPVGMLLRDCEGLRTQWASGHAVTETEARQADRRETTRQWAEDLIAENRARQAPEDPDGRE